MNNQIKKVLFNKFPQNYILRNAYLGGLIIALFCFGFAILYTPLRVDATWIFSYGEAMAIYSLSGAIATIASIKLLKGIRYFSNGVEWTFLKELLSIAIVLFGLGLAVYFMAFLVEPPAQRWNFATFLDSCKKAFLIGILPFSFFTARNFPYLLGQTYYQRKEEGDLNTYAGEEKIHISSKLKNENLSFYPSQFLYAESNGNYVTFYLKPDHQIKKKTIRNSISNIELQLSEIPYCLRTHRAFIVNVKEVQKKQGNTLGYRIKLEGSDFEIPVSRQKTKIFNERISQFQE